MFVSATKWVSLISMELFTLSDGEHHRKQSQMQMQMLNVNGSLKLQLLNLKFPVAPLANRGVVSKGPFILAHSVADANADAIANAQREWTLRSRSH